MVAAAVGCGLRMRDVAYGMAFGWLIVGLALGAILGDVGRLQVLLRTWPVLHEVIRWERVAELLNSDEKSGANKSA